MTRRLVAGQPGAAGGIGVAVVASADGSIDWTSPTGPTADASVKAFGGVTVIRTAADLDVLAVGGVITVNSKFLLTGIFTIADGNHIVETVNGSIVGTHQDETGIIGNFDGPLVEGAVLERFIIKNISVGPLAEDHLLTDLSGRTARVAGISPTGTRSGTISNLSGPSEIVGVFQNGTTRGYLASNLITALRLISCTSTSATAGFISFDYDASVVIVVGLELGLGGFVTSDPTASALRMSNAMTTGVANVEVIGNVVTGTGHLIDQSLGNIDANDVRLVAKANTESPDFTVLGQATFQDAGLPISHTPSSSDISVFDVMPIQNVGPAATLALTSRSRRAHLQINGTTDWYIEILGPISDLLPTLRFSIGVTKSGTTRQTLFKWFIQSAGVGPWAPLDTTEGGIEVSTTESQAAEQAAIEVDSADRLRVQVASESTDTMTFSKLLFEVFV